MAGGNSGGSGGSGNRAGNGGARGAGQGSNRAGGNSSSSLRKLVLMNRTHEVCVVEYNTDAHFITGIVELCDGAAHGPIGILSADGAAIDRLSSWWGNRSIPQSRPDIANSLNTLGLSTPLELPEFNHGLSLSDQYWMKAPGNRISWQDINYFHNDFNEKAGELLFGSRQATPETNIQIAAGSQALDLNIPDNTSDGVQPKRWMIVDKLRCLVKGGGFLNQEPYNELIATRLYQRLLQPEDYVPYALHKNKGRDNGGVCSLCPNMLADDEEFVPAAYIDLLLPHVDGEDSFNHYIRCCQQLGVEVDMSLSKMLVCDYLLANHDRHYRNFGLIRNVDSLSWRLAPLFDTGSSLWCDVRSLRPDNLGYRSHPFIGDPLLQLELVRDCSWYDPERLVGFTAELVGILKEGALRDYGMRLITIEDAIDERIDKLVDICARQ